MDQHLLRTVGLRGGRGILAMAVALSSLLCLMRDGPLTSVTSAQPASGCLELVSLAEIEQAFGLSQAQLTSETRADAPDNLNPGQQNCHWELTGDVYLSLVVYTGGGLEAFEFSWRQAQLQGAEPIQVGEGGLYQANFLGGPGWLVRTRGLGVSVSASDAQGLGRVDLNAATQRILALVLERV
jgi:hypothetical protein